MLIRSSIALCASRRNDRELLEQGLNQYKSRQKELERVAKGLAPLPLRLPPSIAKRVIEVSHCFIVQSPRHPTWFVKPSPIAVSKLPLSRTRSDSSGDVVGPFDGSPMDNGYLARTASFASSAAETPNESQGHDGIDRDDVGDSEPSPKIELIPEDREGIDALCATSATHIGRRKLPPWKRPPVPVFPAEFYACKAVLPVS